MSALVYDVARDRVVLYLDAFNNGVMMTWELDGTSWNQMPPGPSGRWGHRMTYAPTQAAVLLFGGQFGGAYKNDLWKYNGTTWTQLGTTGTQPTVRADMAVAFDSNRRVLVVHGGTSPTTNCDGNGATNKLCRGTYEMNASNVWSMRAFDASTDPPAAAHESMAYDPNRGKVVLASSGGTYELDASGWRPLNPGDPEGDGGPVAVDPNRNNALVYDVRQQKVVDIDVYSATAPGAVWAWDGTSWMNRHNAPTACTPPTFADSAGTRVRYDQGFMPDGGAGYDPLHRKYFSLGWTVSDPNSVLLTWNTLGCTVTPTVGGPDRRAGASVAFDGNRLWLFGGSSPARTDFWRWSAGGGWTKVVASPAPVTQGRLFYDASRRVILHYNPTTAGVWEWNGTAWKQRCDGTVEVCANPPTAGGPAWFDTLLNRLSFPAADGNTWSWNGTAWQARQTALTASLDNVEYDEEANLAIGTAYGSQDVQIYDGNTWTAATVQDAFNNGDVYLHSREVAYAPHRQVLYMLDADRELDLGHTRRPAHVFAVDTRSLGPYATGYSGLSVTWSAGGTGRAFQPRRSIRLRTPVGSPTNFVVGTDPSLASLNGVWAASRLTYSALSGTMTQVCTSGTNVPGGSRCVVPSPNPTGGTWADAQLVLGGSAGSLLSALSITLTGTSTLDVTTTNATSGPTAVSYGAELRVYDAHGWHRLNANGNAAGDAAAITWSGTAADLTQLMLLDRRHLYFQVTPVSPGGGKPATLQTDGVEVRVRYY